jgi:hypothetical protein
VAGFGFSGFEPSAPAAATIASWLVTSLVVGRSVG